MSKSVRNLHIVFGDQLSDRLQAFKDFDADKDAVLMMEVEQEATYVPQHKIRLVLFFSAMRHFRDHLRDKGFTVHYADLDDDNDRGSFGEEIPRWINKLHPEELVATQPGEHRVEEILRKAAKDADLELRIVEDDHFMCSLETFREWASDRKSLVLERFYRSQRQAHGILMDGDNPVGGDWNFDEDNRESFGKKGPPEIKAPRSFRADEITEAVIEMVEDRFTDSPGSLEGFDYPVTRKQALEALRDFIEYRLADFGTYQDAMAKGHPYLYHSRLSCVMNLHLIDPDEIVEAAVSAYEDGYAPINAVEGFVRQIMGWREYVRGIYWTRMPDYANKNHLDADRDMPAFMWTGETDMACVADAVGQLNDHAYAHHIQRLMVLGLFSLLVGVRPYDVHRWHMSMYADAIDWVSLPNVLGMSQFGDGGVMATKPYAASGNYINRMGDYCKDCRYKPKEATGEDACPFTTLFWDFLSRNRSKLQNNRRMTMMYKNLDRKSDADRRAIRERAAKLKDEMTAEAYL
ncbi:cryptochrome/photolyase family protein [Tepidamorphus sp. 3E244]|uniref:cryptochrome/photolyase family protein n=1 Tax=Tepidamorphus sp. 3E244 TaxID=3385498 RepID=UPI0038FC5435